MTKPHWKLCRIFNIKQRTKAGCYSKPNSETWGEGRRASKDIWLTCCLHEEDKTNIATYLSMLCHPAVLKLPPLFLPGLLFFTGTPEIILEYKVPVYQSFLLQLQLCIYLSCEGVLILALEQSTLDIIYFKARRVYLYSTFQKGKRNTQ